MLLSLQDIGVSFAGNTILEHITRQRAGGFPYRPDRRKRRR